MVNIDVNENVELRGVVSIKNEDKSMVNQVMYLNANLNAETLDLNINVNVVNKELYKANANEMKAKYIEFENNIKTKASELGYILF